MGLLTNIFFHNGKIHTVYREDSQRKIYSEIFCPWFYVISKEPEQTNDIISRHNMVIGTVIEKKYYKNYETVDAIKVMCDYWHFNQLIKDLSILDIEFAETKIPHYFRYVYEKKLSFLSGNPNELVYSEKNDQNADIIFGYFSKKYLEPQYVEPEKSKDIYCDISETKTEKFIKIMELSRITGVKVEEIVKITPGALNSYLHIGAAWKANYLVLNKKIFVERPKSLLELENIDKGGTIFYPKPGLYKKVAKFDFASLYPNIIVKNKISPEGLGIVSNGIQSILEERLKLKKMMKDELDPNKKRLLNIRQKSLKNILVTCFGYLGFKNFILSNVECKEEVMERGRQIMVEAKELAESFGFEVLYGVVDSLFLIGNGSIYDFQKAANNKFGIDLELDCIFDFIAFPASENGCGIANKYYGVSDGKIEARGISYRHSDSPEFIRRFQERAILNISKIKDIYEFEKSDIQNHPIEDLALKKRLRKQVYHSNSPHVVAAKFAEKSDTIIFVYTKIGPRPLSIANKNDISYSKYLQLLERSYFELIRGIFNV